MEVLVVCLFSQLVRISRKHFLNPSVLSSAEFLNLITWSHFYSKFLSPRVAAHKVVATILRTGDVAKNRRYNIRLVNDPLWEHMFRNRH